MARHLYMRAPVGVGAFTKVYGGKSLKPSSNKPVTHLLLLMSDRLSIWSFWFVARRNNGSRPSHFERGSKHVARAILQGLQELKMVEVHEDGGRVLTSVGRRDLDRIAVQMSSQKA